MEQRTCTFIAEDAMLSLQYLCANNLQAYLSLNSGVMVRRNDTAVVGLRGDEERLGTSGESSFTSEGLGIQSQRHGGQLSGRNSQCQRSNYVAMSSLLP